MRFILIAVGFIFLHGCESVQDMEPVVSFKSNNIISLELAGKGNPTAKVYDTAINHCKKDKYLFSKKCESSILVT